MCSIAATSSPRGSRARQVSRAASRMRAHERERRAAIVERHERQAHRRPRRQHPQRHLGDDAKRALGSDEQVDEVHARGGEVAGRELGHVRHAVARHTNPHGAVGQDDLEMPVAIGHRAAALDVEHVAVGQDDRQRLHPVARGAVLERRRSRRVGGDDAAGEGAGEGGNGRIVAARSCKGGVEIDERDARPDAHRVAAAPLGAPPQRGCRVRVADRPGVEDAVQASGAQHDLAVRCRAAGQRRLRADWQHRRRGPHQRGDFGFRRGNGHAGRESAGKMRGVFDKRREHIRIALDPRRDSRVAVRRARADRVAGHAR